MASNVSKEIKKEVRRIKRRYKEYQKIGTPSVAVEDILKLPQHPNRQTLERLKKIKPTDIGKRFTFKGEEGEKLSYKEYKFKQQSKASKKGWESRREKEKEEEKSESDWSSGFDWSDYDESDFEDYAFDDDYAQSVFDNLKSAIQTLTWHALEKYVRDYATDLLMWLEAIDYLSRTLFLEYINNHADILISLASRIEFAYSDAPLAMSLMNEAKRIIKRAQEYAFTRDEDIDDQPDTPRDNSDEDFMDLYDDDFDEELFE